MVPLTTTLCRDIDDAPLDDELELLDDDEELEEDDDVVVEPGPHPYQPSKYWQLKLLQHVPKDISHLSPSVRHLPIGGGVDVTFLH